jgi:hypothetical protein
MMRKIIGVYVVYINRELITIFAGLAYLLLVRLSQISIAV